MDQILLKTQRIRCQARFWAVICVAFATLTMTPAAHAAQWLSLGIAQESYFARQESLYGLQSYQQVSAHYRGEFLREHIAGRLDFGGILATNVSKYSSIYVPEGYLQLHQQVYGFLPREVNIGRKVEPWSKLDADWDLGLWQPLFRWDYLRPEDQGLTGLFISWKADRTRFTMFASGLFIPEQGPSFHIENGTISSPSPWFSEPTNSVILFSQPTEIQYTIATPRIEEIVFRPSVGLLFELGDREAGPWTSGGYISKPRNSLSLPFHSNLVIGPTSQVAEVTVYPRVERHHLAAFDTGYQGTDIGVFVSALGEFPENTEVPSGLTRQKWEPQLLVSPGLEGRFFSEKNWGPRWSLSYLHQDGGETTDEGPMATSRGSVFGSRLSYARAMSLTLKSSLIRGFERGLDVSIRWIEEFNQRGTVLLSELRYRPVRDWTVSLMADFLGSKATETDQTGLITRFRGNDRVGLGVLYVF